MIRLRRRTLRWIALGVGALAIAQAARILTGAGPEITLRFEAPPGELRVTYHDDHGERIRSTVFGGTSREHTVRLPPGPAQVTLSLDGIERVRSLPAERGDQLTISW